MQKNEFICLFIFIVEGTDFNKLGFFLLPVKHVCIIIVVVNIMITFVKNLLYSASLTVEL